MTTDSLLGLAENPGNRPVSFEEAVRTEAERNADNPVRALFQMYEILIDASCGILGDEAENGNRLPADPGEYPECPRCVVSGRNAFQMSVCSPAVNFIFALFRSGENFGWMKEEDKLTGIASLFALLSDPDALKILRAVHDEFFPSSFTAAYIGEQTGVADGKAGQVLRLMEHFRLCTSETAHLANGEVRVYSSMGSGMLLGLIAIAYELRFGKTAYRHSVAPYASRLIGGGRA